MKYKPLADKVYEFYLGEIREDELKDFFSEWAINNNYPLPKRIRFLKDMAYNCSGEEVPIVLEDGKSIYYNDSFHRYCYLNKCDEGIDFEYIK